jgi:7-carboxy-7-deazaguanine synthase
MGRHWRVAEIFGPTIQGEGRYAGIPCHFIRFGGCDLRCTWCDTPHAVLPALVSQLDKLDVDEICDRVDELKEAPEWVVISGGNPATLKLDEVVNELHARGYKVMVETQGTVFNEWLGRADDICVSPKPPSSGNEVDLKQVAAFLEKTIKAQTAWARERDTWFNLPYLKVVVFDNADYNYARRLRVEFTDLDMFLSVGNDDPTLPTVGHPVPEVELVGHINTREIVCNSFTALAERVARDRHMRNVRVMPQLHVLAWGNARGH